MITVTYVEHARKETASRYVHELDTIQKAKTQQKQEVTMIRMFRGKRTYTTTERRELEKDRLIRQLEHKVWQHESRIEPQALRELKIILERLETVHSEQVTEECRRYTNAWL